MDAPYQRLAAYLRRHIADGTWPVGSQLPSARELRARHHVGRGVVELAVAELRREGIIEGRRGARPIVSRSAPPTRRTYDPRADWPHSTLTPATGTCLATPDLADRMQVPQRTRLLWERTECLDPVGWPAMLLTTYRRGRTRPEYADCALQVDVGEFTVGEAQAIGLAAGAVALRMTRTRYAADGRPAETADLVLRADRWGIRL